MNSLNKKLKWVVLGSAVFGLGLSMPSCPGQQAMQQQIDTLQTANTDLNKKVGALDGQVKKLDGEIGQMKQLLESMAGAIKAQNEAVAQMSADVKMLKERPVYTPPPPAPAKKAPAKKKGK